MKRLIDYHLKIWKDGSYRKPLLLRGARQVGKTYAVRELGKSFDNFVEINLELEQRALRVFEEDLHPERIIQELSLIARKPIHPGKTLLFLDEIQAAPKALIALRYFYEMMPELHVIAAGSLLDFAIKKVGVPVGRVMALYMYPLSFVEYLVAMERTILLEALLVHSIEHEISEIAHTQLLELLGEYLVFGGMPQAVQQWRDTKNPLESSKTHAMLLDFYHQDFGKYARSAQVKYVEIIFEHVPMQLGKKFKYSLVEGDYRKRELAPALDLLVTAGVSHKIFSSAGQGVPLGAQIDPQDYKAMFLDVGLCQTALKLDVAGFFLDPLAEFVNKGSLVEAFIGQEMLVYGDVNRKGQLYYWHRESRTAQAEVDYLIQRQGQVVPIEVKSGLGRTLKSLQLFLEEHKKSSYGIRFSVNNYSHYQNVKSYPLYAVAQVMSEDDAQLREALAFLLKK